MWSAFNNIPDHMLEFEDDEVETKDKDKIIIIFLDENFNITDIDKKTYSEWVSSNKIEQEIVDLLDVRHFITRERIKQSRKGYGGQFGLSTLSPIHFKLSNTYIESIKNRNIEKKVEKFIEEFSKNDDYESEFENNMSKIIKKLFFELIKVKDNKAHIKFNDKLITIEKDDYIFIKIPLKEKETFVTGYNKFLEKVKKSSEKKEEIQNKCIICGKEYREGYSFPISTFEGEQRKHSQIMHHFYNKIEYHPSIKICHNCYKKINNIRKIKKQTKYMPIPLNLRSKDYLLSIIFDKELTLLEKLERIYREKNNPFDYILLEFNNNSQSEEIKLDYIPNFKYYVDINEKILKSKFNSIGKKRDRIEYVEDKKNKKDFLRSINELFLNKLIVNLYKENKDINTKGNTFLKNNIINYKEQIQNFLFKNDPVFQNKGLKEIVKKIFLQCLKNKEYLERFEKGNLGKKIIFYYYLYYFGGDVKMELNNLKEIENNEDVKIDNDFKAAFFLGQIMRYLLERSESKKNRYELLRTELLGVKSITDLKHKILNLTLKYSYALDKVNKRKWDSINNSVLKYNFKNEKFDKNIIAFFTGFYSDNIFYKKSNEGDSNE